MSNTTWIINEITYCEDYETRLALLKQLAEICPVTYEQITGELA